MARLWKLRLEVFDEESEHPGWEVVRLVPDSLLSSAAVGPKTYLASLIGSLYDQIKERENEYGKA